MILEQVVGNEVPKEGKISLGNRFLRICHYCGGETLYNKKYNYIRARNKRCTKCRQNGNRNSFYKKKHSEKTKSKLSKKLSGSGNPMYGTDGGMFGKRHSMDTINKQSVARKKYWKKRGHKFVPAFRKYRNEVTRLTEKQPIHLLENHKNRGKAGKDGAFHLDHIKSVWYGYTNNIEPSQIADISNLRFIPCLENQKKWYK
jgi:hypothetical protein